MGSTLASVKVLLPLIWLSPICMRVIVSLSKKLTPAIPIVKTATPRCATFMPKRGNDAPINRLNPLWKILLRPPMIATISARTPVITQMPSPKVAMAYMLISFISIKIIAPAATVTNNIGITYGVIVLPRACRHASKGATGITISIRPSKGPTEASKKGAPTEIRAPFTASIINGYKVPTSTVADVTTRSRLFA